MNLPPRDVYDWQPIVPLKGLLSICFEGAAALVVIYTVVFFLVSIFSDACCCRDELQSSIRRELAA